MEPRVTEFVPVAAGWSVIWKSLCERGADGVGDRGKVVMPVMDPTSACSQLVRLVERPETLVRPAPLRTPRWPGSSR